MHAAFEATHVLRENMRTKTRSIRIGDSFRAMMFDYPGWSEAARMIETSLEATIQQKFVTYEL